MCGIIGYSGYFLEKPVFEEAIQSLQHRGPDDFGLFIKNNTGLGHRRLSIIDLSSKASQPFNNETNKIHLIVNGEIYNYKQIQNELKEKHLFISDSDCEVLLHGYEEWGIKTLLSKLNGMYSFCIFDEDIGSLFIVRDRIGIKPLYFWSDNNRIAFSSEIQPLTKIIPERLSINEYARDSYFSFGFIPGNLCIFKNCHKVLPGHYIEFNYFRKLIQSNKYWECPEPSLAKADKGYDYIGDIKSLIDDSVRSRMMSDRPIGVFLSGGIDSSLIASTASQFVSKIKTFSIGFDYLKFDESKYAKGIANFLGTEHTELICTEKEAIETINLIPEIYGEPFADASAIPTLILSHLTRKEVAVALSGDGGDELTLGYEGYDDAAKISLLLNFPFKRNVSFILGKLFNEDTFLGKLSKALKVKTVAEGCHLSRGMFHSLFFSRIFGREFDINRSYWFEKFNKLDGYPIDLSWAWVDLQHFLIECLLTKVDRASMFHSLEVRVPLLDYRVVESILKTPASMKKNKKDGKIVLKRILSNYLPTELWDRPKMGFAPPYGEWIKGPIKPMVLEYLSSSRLNEEGIFNVKFIEQILREHFDGIKNNETYIWNLLVWEMCRDYYKTMH